MASRIISVLFKSNAGSEAGKVAVYGKAITGFGGSSRKMATDVKASGSLVQNALGSMGVNAKQFGTVMQAGMVGGAVAGSAALVSFAKKGVDAFVGLAGEVRNFQRATGASAEDSSRWVAVLDDMEIASDKGEKAAFKLARTIGEGGEGLREFGVEVKTNRDGTVDLSETLLNVADAYTSTQDPAQRAALVQEAFGRAGKDLIPILEQGRQGLQRFFEGAEEGHQMITQEDLDKAREYELAVDRLSDVMRGFSLQIGSAIVPTLTSATDGLAGFVSGVDTVTSKVGGFDTVLSASISSGVAPFVHGLGTAGALMRGDFVGATEEATRSIPILGSAIADNVPFFDDGEEASTSYADAQSKVGEAAQKVADLEAEGKEGTKEYSDARRDFNAVSNEFAGTQGRVDTAMKGATQSMAMQKLAADPLAASIKDIAAVSGDAIRDQFLLGGALAGQAENVVKSREAEISFRDAVASGAATRIGAAADLLSVAAAQKEYANQIAMGAAPVDALKEADRARKEELGLMTAEQAEATALTAALAESERAGAQAKLQGLGPAAQSREAAKAYRLELMELSATLPVDSPLRAYLDRDLGMMEAAKEGIKEKNRALWADMWAITNTGGQNVVAIEQFWRTWGIAMQGIKDGEEKLGKTKLMSDVLAVYTSGGNDLAAMMILQQDIQHLIQAGGGQKSAKALTDALADGVITADEIMGLQTTILNDHVNSVLTGVGQAPSASRGGPTGKKPIRYQGGGTGKGYALGGIHEADPSRPGIYPGGPIRFFAEPVVGNEAYIPQKGIGSDRALSILDVAASWYGAKVQRFAEGGLTLEELFYDPRGGWDNGVSIGAIGGHMDHVHAGAATGHTWPELDAYLITRGINPGAGSTTGGRHAVGSLHYQGRAKDYGSAANPNLNAIWDAFLPLASGGAAAAVLARVLPAVPEIIDAVTNMGGWARGDAARPTAKRQRDTVVDWQKNVQAMLDAASRGGGGSVGGGVHAGPFKEYAASRLAAFGWGPEQFGPLDMLWTAESGWDPNAQNPTSDAAGIPQDITGNLHGGGYGQIDWGLNYIKGRYGSPAAAWAFHQRNNWYAKGGLLEPAVADWGADLVPGINVLRNNTGAIEKLRPVDGGAARGDTVFDFRGALIYGDRRSFERMVNDVFDGRQEVWAQDTRRA